MRSRSPVTLATFAHDWLVLYRSRWSRRTSYLYEWTLRQYVLPTLGAVRLRDVTPLDVQTLAAALLARNLGTATVKSALAILAACYADAIELGVAKINPTRRIARRIRHQPKRPAQWFDEAQLSLFLTSAVTINPSIAALFYVCAEGGLRVGEASALQPADVNTTTRQVTIRRSVATGSRVGPPKGGKIRVVDLPRRTMTALAPHLAEPRWCFPGRDPMQPIGYTHVRKTMHRICEAAGIPRATPHALRHTFGSILIARRESPAYVQRQLGHATITMTIAVYGSHIEIPRPAWYDADPEH